MGLTDSSYQTGPEPNPHWDCFGQRVKKEQRAGMVAFLSVKFECFPGTAMWA